jgi:hypothetical protein
MDRLLAKFFLAALGAAALSGAAVAQPPQQHSASQHLDFKIVIPRILRLRLIGQPRAIRVTQADVERGEVTVRGARAELVANGRNGYRVRTELTDEAFSSMTMKGLSRPIENAERVAVTWMRPMVGAEPGPSEVEYRFRLAPGTKAGDYPWPVVFTLEDA